ITSRSSQAFCTLAPASVAPTPSIVVTARLPIAPTRSRHERTGLPSICTVQAPHCAMPQPNFEQVAQHPQQWHVIRRLEGPVFAVDLECYHRESPAYFASLGRSISSGPPAV